MERLTSNKKVSDMSMFELAHNSCYCKDGVARYRDFENDIDARDLARELVWSLADIELSRNNECFDEEIIENLQYDITKEPIGLIALFYRNLWAMADLRERLKEYEDLEEQCRLIKLPCKVGDVVYRINIGAMKPVIPLRVVEYRFKIVGNCIREKICCSDDFLCKQPSIIYYAEDIGNKVFLTKSEAEAKLKELRGGENE